MQPRRRFLKVLVASSVGACGPADETQSVTSISSSGGGGGASPSPLPEGYTAVGDVADLPLDTLLEHPSLDLLVGRDAAGIYVMTSRCTHQGCNMIGNDGVAPDLTVTCGCHGSVFDRFGQVLKGPAMMTLAHFHVIITEDGLVGVDLTQVVDESFRAVP